MLTNISLVGNSFTYRLAKHHNSQLRVIIFSTGVKFQQVSNFMELPTLTQATGSQALLRRVTVSGTERIQL